jgi:ferredoxin-NADP reductase/Na+-translocating ferredoxin:NAD+ oxidoreductase RnfD subunit
MITFIDKLLNKIPMYRITLYFVLVLWVVAILFGSVGLLPYSGAIILLSGLFLMTTSWLSNELLAWAFERPTNHESAVITGLILALILTPAATAAGLWILGLAALLAMGTKYMLSMRGKHLFNPAAVSVVLTSLVFSYSASWWVGTLVMFPFVAVGGILLVRKIARTDLVVSFMVTAVAFALGYYLVQRIALLTILQQLFINSSMPFLGFVMLTEPLTTPSTSTLRIVYGALVGLLFLPFVHFGSFYFTPELALVVGNLFVFAVSPKQKLVFTLKKKIRQTGELYDFVFESNRPFTFTPGQYMEWTLANVPYDRKGNRRYFTIASSPTEREVHVGIRLQAEVSEFKNVMLNMQVGDKILASQLSGDFVLPKNKKEKIAFIAGGIGITPFRSMIKHMVDSGDTRQAALLYSNKMPEDIMYTDVFEEARIKMGVKTVYAVTNAIAANDWAGVHAGRITKEMIATELPDYKERTFYVSGSEAMVTGVKRTLTELGIARANIKTDYFPGFA